jgi:myo-inositol 2-dehydrogenase/D-chiro-inositol 1-dehydrogenase
VSEPLRIGLLGAGRMGRVHAEHVARLEGAELVAVADVSPDAARSCAGALGVQAVFDSARPVLASSEVDAVLVCSATDTHAELVAAAAEHGKHVFCEKPLALDLASIDRALASVEAAGVRFQVGFNRRFDPGFREVFDAARAGAVGAPELLRITSRDVEPPPLDYVPASGGLFLDMTIHDFDLARFLVGREVSRVSALGSVRIDARLRELADVDTAIALLEFEGGLIASLENSRRAVYGYDQRVELFGSEGVVTAGESVEGLVTAPARAPARDDQLERYLESYRLELEAFVDCVRSGEPSPVNGYDARQAVVLGLAARLSHREGRAVDPRELG